MTKNARGRILVVNPNSNPAVTSLFSAELESLRFADGPEIVCETLAEGPLGIESELHVAAIAEPLRRLVMARDDADAFVIACYSDPGLYVCREATAKPVFGIQSCGIAFALSLGERYGVLALKTASIKRHLRYLRQLGLVERLAGERPLDLTVAESAEGEHTLDRLTKVGKALRDIDGADVLLLGCAGMARHRAPLEERLGIPVVDPVQAGVAMAVSTLCMRRVVR
jgi:Asp/Glu/hydantoin racemase